MVTGSSPTAPERRRTRLLVAAVLVGVVVVCVAAAAARGLRSHDGHETGPGTARSTSAYFLGTSPTGLRLYAEPHRVRGSGDAFVLAALRQLTTSYGATDPDYRTAWPAGSFDSARVADRRIVVALGAPATRRPSGVSPAVAELGLQQVVHTADAATGTDLPVAFRGGDPLGVRSDPLVRPDRSFDLLAPVDLSGLADGTVVRGSLTARGRVSGEVTTVRWRLDGPDGTTVRSGTARPQGSTWSTGPIDLGGLAPGRYVVTASATSTGQTSAATGNFTDTRNVIIK